MPCHQRHCPNHRPCGGEGGDRTIAQCQLWLSHSRCHYSETFQEDWKVVEGGSALPKLSPPRLSMGPVRPKISCGFPCKCPLGSCQGVGGKESGDLVRPKLSPFEVIRGFVSDRNFQVISLERSTNTLWRPNSRTTNHTTTPNHPSNPPSKFTYSLTHLPTHTQPPNQAKQKKTPHRTHAAYLPQPIGAPTLPASVVRWRLRLVPPTASPSLVPWGRSASSASSAGCTPRPRRPLGTSPFRRLGPRIPSNIVGP